MIGTHAEPDSLSKPEQKNDRFFKLEIFIPETHFADLRGHRNMETSSGHRSVHWRRRNDQRRRGAES